MLKQFIAKDALAVENMEHIKEQPRALRHASLTAAAPSVYLHLRYFFCHYLLKSDYLMTGDYVFIHKHAKKVP